MLNNCLFVCMCGGGGGKNIPGIFADIFFLSKHYYGNNDFNILNQYLFQPVLNTQYCFDIFFMTYPKGFLNRDLQVLTGWFSQSF